MALPFPRCCPWPPTGLRYPHLGTAQVCSGLLRGKGRERVLPDLFYVEVAQSCLTLCDPMDYTVHGIL